MKLCSLAIALACILCQGIVAKFITDANFIEPVPLQDIRLEPDSQFDKAVSLNKEYLLGIDNDRLLKTFRLNAGLDAPGESFSGSWEDPACEVRGQYMGHWLSGTAMLAKNTGDQDLLDKSKLILMELRRVQGKMGGYLSAFPKEHFERLRSLQPVWAPFYVIHKIMAGLLDHYLFLGDKMALQMVLEEAAFFQRYIQDVLGNEGEEHWIQMLEVEYGGMEETLFNLYGVTGDKQWAEMAVRFTKPNWFVPLTQADDVLPGRHANTHLAQVNGFAAGYEVAGSEGRLKAASNFFDLVTNAHSYATGGNNDGEFWQAPHQLASTLAAKGSGLGTEETCTTYNMLKLARYLFRWTGDARYADYYERAILNGMLGTQRIPANYTSPTRRSGRRLHMTSDHTAPVIHSRSDGELALSEMQASGLEASPLLLTKTSRSAVKNATWQSHNWRQDAMQLFPGNQAALPENDNSPGPGVILYLLPLGAGNRKADAGHGWSTPLNSFWCCSGSTSESFSKLMDSIYFQRVKEGLPPQLYVNQFTPSSLSWRAAGLELTQKVSLDENHNTMKITLETTGLAEAAQAASAILKIRIPKWAAEASFKIEYGGVSEVEALQGSPLPFYWNVGISPSLDCRIELKIRMAIRTEPINDDRAEFANLQAVLNGPHLMAALTDGDRDISLASQNIDQHVFPVNHSNLVTLRTASGQVLKQSGKRISLAEEADCLSLMDCTFRLIQWSGAGTESIRLESMTMPGQLMVLDAEGNLRLSQTAGESYVEFAMIKENLSGSLQIRADDSSLAGASHEVSGLSMSVETALGSYPEGARVLKGSDRSYVIAPIGHIIEEQYSPYLQFNTPSLLPS